MKSLLTLIALLLAFQVQAVSIGVDTGKSFSSLNGSSAVKPGNPLLLGGEWLLPHEGDVRYAGTLQASYLISNHFFHVIPSLRASYVSFTHQPAGYVLSPGIGIIWPVAEKAWLFADYHFAPDTLTYRMHRYEDMRLGVGLAPGRALHLQAGYRALTLDGQHGHRDRSLTDGWFIGARYLF